MKRNELILLSRAGCCLCAGLEERLTQLALDKLDPPLELFVKDIDNIEMNPSDHARYSLEVPVLLLKLDNPIKMHELPRVSPRLTDEALFNWLKKAIQEQTRKT